MPTLSQPRQLEESPRFVGRAEELATVEALLHATAAGTGAGLVIVGESGIGKSRLLRECARLKSPVTALAAQCGADAHAGFGLAAQLSAEMKRHGLESHHAAGSAAAGVARDRGVAQTRVARNGGAASGETQFLAGLADLCRRRAVAVYVDDVDRAENDDLRMLEALFALTRRVRLVLVAACAANERTNLTAPRRTLQRLTDAECELLLRSVAVGLNVRGDEMRELLDAVEGSPLLAIECAERMPARADAIVGSLASISRGSEIPSARAAVAHARATLSKHEFDILALCSVVGRSFHAAWILDLADASASAVADALQAGVDGGILLERDAEPGWFDFRHSAVHATLYASIVSPKRRISHECIAPYLSARADPHDPRAATLAARQWTALGNRDEAATWHVRAAAEGAKGGDFTAAATSYGRALNDLPKGTPRWFEVADEMRRCYRNLAEWGRMGPHVEMMLSAYDRRSDPTRTDSLLWDWYYAKLNDGDRDGARTVADELADVDLPGQRPRAAAATLLLAYAMCYAAQRDEARALIATVDPTTLEAEGRLRYLTVLANINLFQQPLEKSLALADESAELARTLGKRGTAFALIGAAEISLLYGDVERAARYNEKAEAIAATTAGETNDVKRAMTKSWIRLATVTGGLAHARELIYGSLGWRDSGRYNQSRLAGYGVLIGMRTGDLALVDALFDPDLLRESVAARDVEATGVLIPGFAEVMQVRGMARELRALLQTCVERRIVDPYTWVLQAAVRYGAAECADAAMPLLDEFFKDAIAPTVIAHRALLASLLARRRGKNLAACELGRTAAKAYGDCGWRLLQAVALEAADERARASAVYVECGATFEAERLAGGQTRKLRRAPFGARLTPREVQVARLVARKHSNNDVAQALGLSVRTVHHHVEAAFNKLGIHARWQLTEEMLRTK